MQDFIDLPEEERKSLQRLFKKLGEYPPRILAQTLSQIHNLGLVKLDGNGYGEDVVYIADMLRSHMGIYLFDLSHNRIPVEGARALADAIKENKRLEIFKIDRNPITDEGAAALAGALLVNSKLKSLSVMDCQLSVPGIRAFCEVLKTNKTHLISLHLSGNMCGNDGAALVADALLVNKTLRYINLEDCMIADDGAIALFKTMQKNAGVIINCTRFNMIGDEQLKAKIDALVKTRREQFLKYEKDLLKSEKSKLKEAQERIKDEQKKIRDMNDEMTKRLRNVVDKEKTLDKSLSDRKNLKRASSSFFGKGETDAQGTQKLTWSKTKGANEFWCMLAGSDGSGEQDIFDGFLATVPGSASGNELERFVSGDIPVGKKSLRLSLRHYAGGSKMAKARYLGFQAADVIVYLFSMTDRLTFTDIEEEIYDDAMYALYMADKDTPFYLVGTHADQRSNPPASNEVTTDEAQKMAQKLNAKGFFEISSKDPTSLSKVVETIAQYAAKVKK